MGADIQKMAKKRGHVVPRFMEHDPPSPTAYQFPSSAPKRLDRIVFS